MKKIKINFNSGEFYLSLFIILSIFKTPYIGILTQYLEIESTPVAFVVRLLIIIFGIIIFFLQKKKLIHKNFFYIIFLFFLLLVVTSIQLEQNHSIELGQSLIYYFGFAFSIIAFVTIVYSSHKNLSDLSNPFFYILIIFSFFTLLLGSDEVQNRHRLNSLDAITTGYFASMLFLISCWRIYYQKNKKFTSLIGLLLSLILVYEANSRSPLIGIMFGIIFFLYNRSLKYFLFILITSIFFLIFIFFIDIDNLDLRLFDLKDVSIGIRLDIYKNYYDAILNNAFFPDVNPVNHLTMAHNIFLAAYSGTGIFGLIIFIYLVYHTLIASYKLVNKNSRYGWVSLIFILTLIKATFSDALLSESFWFFLVLVNAYYVKFKIENFK